MLHAPPDLPHTEQVRDNDSNQLKQPTTGHTLERATNDQCLHTRRSGTHNRADKEPRNRQQQYRLTTPDIGQLGPDTSAGCISEQVRPSNPGIPRRGMEIRSYGWDCRGHNGLV